MIVSSILFSSPDSFIRYSRSTVFISLTCRLAILSQQSDSLKYRNETPGSLMISILDDIDNSSLFLVLKEPALFDRCVTIVQYSGEDGIVLRNFLTISANSKSLS